MKKLFFSLLFIQLLYPSAYAQEVAKGNKMREFLVSATYGTLVGALVGAATLAFEENPDDNLQQIARGASLGLYAGIILGIYVTNYYGQEKAPEGEILPEEESIPGVDVFFEPMIHEKKVDGLRAHLTVFRF